MNPIYKWLSVFATAGSLCLITANTWSQPSTNTLPKILWGVNLGTSYVDTSPAVAPDGTIYVGAWNGKLFAISPKGEIKWSFSTGADIRSSPAIDRQGRILFGSRDKHLYCLASSGKLLWRFQTAGWIDSSPALGPDNEVYFGSWDKNFYALSPKGEKLWTFPTDGPIVASPAVDKDGTIYFGSHDSNFYALTRTGELKWKFATGGPIISSPAIAGDGTVYFTSTDGRVFALSPDGTLKWSLWTGGFTESSPVIDGLGDIYLCVTNALVKISADGKLVWTQRIGTLLAATSPTILANDAVCVYGPDGTFSCHSTIDGKWIWRIWMFGPGTASSPAVTPNGHIYVGNIHTNFLAIATTNRLANTSWPIFKRNLRRTGNVDDIE